MPTPTDKQYPCDLCKRIFNHPGTLTNHRRACQKRVVEAEEVGADEEGVEGLSQALVVAASPSATTTSTPASSDPFDPLAAFQAVGAALQGREARINARKRDYFLMLCKGIDDWKEEAVIEAFGKAAAQAEADDQVPPEVMTSWTEVQTSLATHHATWNASLNKRRA